MIMQKRQRFQRVRDADGLHKVAMQGTAFKKNIDEFTHSKRFISISRRKVIWLA